MDAATSKTLAVLIGYTMPDAVEDLMLTRERQSMSYEDLAVKAMMGKVMKNEELQDEALQRDLWRTRNRRALTWRGMLDHSERALESGYDDRRLLLRELRAMDDLLVENDALRAANIAKERVIERLERHANIDTKIDTVIIEHLKLSVEALSDANLAKDRQIKDLENLVTAKQ